MTKKAHQRFPQKRNEIIAKRKTPAVLNHRKARGNRTRQRNLHTCSSARRLQRGKHGKVLPRKTKLVRPSPLKRVHQKIRHYSYVIIILQGFPFVNTFPNICSTIFYFFKISKNVLFLAKASAVIALISIAYIWAIPSL